MVMTLEQVYKAKALLEELDRLRVALKSLDRHPNLLSINAAGIRIIKRGRYPSRMDAPEAIVEATKVQIRADIADIEAELAGLGVEVPAEEVEVAAEVPKEGSYVDDDQPF